VLAFVSSFMRTIATILVIVAVIGFGIWLFGHGTGNPGIPTTGSDSSIDSTSTDNGVYMYGNTNDSGAGVPSTDSTDYHTKG
jgi:hypothetical protein